MVEVIYIRGNDPDAPAVAQAAGMPYGIRHDCTPYAPVYMLDIHWQKYVWSEYLERVAEYLPQRALVPDYEKPNQTALLRQIAEVRAAGAQEVVVCVKFLGAVNHCPQDVIIALPCGRFSQYGSPLYEVKGRRVHLLGGSPKQQITMMSRVNGYGGEVVSVDSNHFARRAAYGYWFDGGVWHRVPRDCKALELEFASARNYAAYIQRNAHLVQKALF